MNNKPARLGDHCVVAEKSQADTAEATDGLSRSQTFGRRFYQAVLKQNRQLLRIFSTLRDEVSRLEEALKLANRLANYDSLTGLPNRRLLADRFTLASALAKRHGKQTALLFVDLDDFKHVNDDLGHLAGDKVLQQVATRLTTCIRDADTACRFGGDEFVVLLTDVAGQSGALTAIAKIVANLAAPYEIGNTSIRMTVSVGMAIHPDDGDNYTDLLQRSDRSMYRDKVLKTHLRSPRQDRHSPTGNSQALFSADK